VDNLVKLIFIEMGRNMRFYQSSNYETYGSFSYAPAAFCGLKSSTAAMLALGGVGALVAVEQVNFIKFTIDILKKLAYSNQ